VALRDKGIVERAARIMYSAQPHIWAVHATRKGKDLSWSELSSSDRTELRKYSRALQKAGLLSSGRSGGGKESRDAKLGALVRGMPDKWTLTKWSDELWWSKGALDDSTVPSFTSPQAALGATLLPRKWGKV
jgi:hypothetical protein